MKNVIINNEKKLKFLITYKLLKYILMIAKKEKIKL